MIGVAAFLQYVVTLLALRVLRVTRKEPAWLLITAVALLMAVRRTIVLIHVLWPSTSYQPDVAAEYVGLAISVLMLIGMARIRPFFIEIQTSREALRRRTHELAERVKELNLFFEMSRLTERPEASLETVARGLVELCARAWQYPEIACARATLRGEVFTTANFQETDWRQTADILVRGQPIGQIEIGYLEPRPNGDEGPFLKEERRLLNTMAERLGTLVEHDETRKRLQHHQVELARVSRISTMGGMASGLAHELNQPLCAISSWLRGCMDMVRSGSASPDELLRALEVAAEQTQRAADIIEHLRALMGKGDVKRESDDANDIIRRAFDMASPEAKQEGVCLQLDLNDRPRPVMVNSIQIEQVVLNLVRNGLDAIQECPTAKPAVTIRTSDTPAGELEVAVHNSGQAVAPAIQAHVFEPFFTTKPEGMGLGLSICQSIIESHGGRLWVTTNGEPGTTFRFTLPRSEERSPDAC
ncbi:MAG: hypothetical protein JXA69_00105 [Phycisphaerae bacterium]|nr:hypothetical protein [Phycisphaerae bacterium]